MQPQVPIARVLPLASARTASWCEGTAPLIQLVN